MQLKTQPRLYQEKIFASATKENTLVILPTGLGKTLIALMLTLHNINKGRIMMLAPTKPLCEQHKKTFITDSELSDNDCAVITGALKPVEREELYNKQVIFTTPQTARNDIITRKINLNNYSLLIFDEAHRATGNYAYNFIAQQYTGRILGLSASPGTDSESIKKICENLKITNIESRTEKDDDVKEYIKEKKTNNILIELPLEFKEIISNLKKTLSNCLQELKNEGALKNYDTNKIFKKEILNLQKEAINNKQYSIMSLTAKTLKVMHSTELIQTQGINSLKEYFQSMKINKSKAARELIRNSNFQEAMHQAFNTSIEHPKINKLINLLNEQETQLVFTQYRATAELLTKKINDNGGKARLFIGQRGSNGMSQKKQIQLLNEFRNGEFNTLISTSISEEGIDIPRIDKAIFYEPVPSALRTVQRRGRVGRAKTGEVIVLITKDTIDEKNYWVSHYKEKRMNKAIKEIKNTNLSQEGLKKFL